jgi:hypothetical protein
MPSGSLVAPSFTAEPVSYTAIKVSWTNPASGNLLRLVRNSFGIPVDESDGVVLIQQGLVGVTTYLDSALGSGAGNFFYYSLFVQDAAQNWWRSGDEQVIFPKDWGYKSVLMSALPSYLFDLDTQTIL